MLVASDITIIQFNTDDKTIPNTSLIWNTNSRLELQLGMIQNYIFINHMQLQQSLCSHDFTC